MFNTSNPVLRKVGKYQNVSGVSASYGGVTVKTLYFITLVLASAILSAVFVPKLMLSNPSALITALIVGSIGALVCGFISAWSVKSVPVSGSLYAIFEGALLGVISLLFEAQYQGIVLAGLLSTVVVLMVMMLLYYTGMIRVGSRLKRVVLSAVIGVVVSQLVFLLVSLIAPSFANAIYSNIPLQIVVSLLMIILAASMILIDLDNITNIVEGGMDKQYEWTAAYGLTLTLIWLYLQMIRLIALLATSFRRQ